MRIDPLLHFWKAEDARRDALAKLASVDPKDAESWRAFLDKLFAAADGRKACGIKQLQAYGRCLAFPAPKDEDVVWRGDLTPEQQAVFQNWVVNECCHLAGVRNWPHQVHVGTHNLAQSSPLPLEDLARRHPRVKFVLLHCWPFLDESGWLAKYVPNVYIDTCWQVVLNPQFYADALEKWLCYVPLHKIMCGHDATSVEMAAGSASLLRPMLAGALANKAALLSLNAVQLETAAAGMLHGNAEKVYSC
jgi:predicted TIM-barrel fold metal-dependent hydrolase